MIPSIALIILGIVAGFLLLLCIPLRFSLEVKFVNSVEAAVKTQWLFGLIRIQTPLNVKAKSNKEQDQKPKQFLKKLQAWSLKHDLIKARMQTIRSLMKYTQIEKLIINLKVGLKEPDQTGLLSGFSYGLKPLILQQQPEWCDIQLHPDFQRIGIRGLASITIRTIPLIYLALICSVGFHIRILKLIKK